MNWTGKEDICERLWCVCVSIVQILQREYIPMVVYFMLWFCYCPCSCTVCYMSVTSSHAMEIQSNYSHCVHMSVTHIHMHTCIYAQVNAKAIHPFICMNAVYILHKYMLIAHSNTHIHILIHTDGRTDAHIHTKIYNGVSLSHFWMCFLGRFCP